MSISQQVIIFGAKYLFAVIIVIASIYLIRQNAWGRKKILLLACISLPLAYIVAKLSSMWYFDPRPFVTGHFTPLIPHAPDNGFPSDHTLISAAVASVVYFMRENLGWFLLFLAFLVGASRVGAGVHSWIDIFGSMVIAFGVTWLVNFAIMKYRKTS